MWLWISGVAEQASGLPVGVLRGDNLTVIYAHTSAVDLFAEFSYWDLLRSEDSWPS